MIEGLKVIVSPVELKELCEKRAAFHIAKAEMYAKKVIASKELHGDGGTMATSMRNPTDEYVNKENEHKNSAIKLQFIATHLKDSDYLLSNRDLVELGISSDSIGLFG